MHQGQRIALYSLPLLFSLCVCSTLVIAAGSIIFNRAPQPTRTVPEDQVIPVENRIQNLEAAFTNAAFTDAELVQGQQLYLQYCAACHGPEGQGQFPNAPLEPDSTGRIGAPPHNDTGHTWHHSDFSLIQYVIEGGFSDLSRYYRMPPFANVLNDDEIRWILGYIKTLWTPEQREMQRQLTEDEKKMFAN